MTGSMIAEAIRLRHAPVALYWSDAKPDDAVQFEKGGWGCVMFLIVAAARGKTAAIDRETCGCVGGAVGMGFGNRYLDFPGGVDCFHRFLSSGNEGWEKGREEIRKMEAFAARKEFLDHYAHGEGYKKTPELVEEMVGGMPMVEIPRRYVILKPLGEPATGEDPPVTVTFLVDADQLAGLVVLANYGRPGFENVSIPFVAGCQAVGILPYREARSGRPRATVGLIDISARRYPRKALGKDMLSFTVPYAMFLEMEENIGGSFLTKSQWRKLAD
jgi:hypothetical protein